jgi:small subunit ribosomal protein S17
MKNQIIALVTKISSEKSVIVYIFRKNLHPIFLKILKNSKKLIVHNTLPECKPGNIVLIKKMRTISKKKNWSILKIINK